MNTGKTMVEAAMERGQDRGPTPEERVRDAAAALVVFAADLGYVVNIEQRPLKPLAMTHYETTIDVRPDRRPK